jgi:arabinan endo-1,5-alpha-L-arabinosidase
MPGFVSSPCAFVAAVVVALASAACVEAPDVIASRTEQLTPELLSLSGDVELTDPSAIYADETFWIVSSGPQLPIRTSSDLRAFDRVGNAFAALPDWVATEVPGAESFWSPDVAYFNGLYHLYYAVSTVNDNQSCIGHATAPALPAIESWTDLGPLICSHHDDNWNAIDPNVLVDDDGLHWLALGSFRSGIKLILLDQDGMRSGSELVPLAKRPDAGAIQAPALSHQNGFYYLYVAFGEYDGHTLNVGRANSIRGPYLDRDGVDLWAGGGSLLLGDAERFHGPGSNDVLTVGEQSFNVYHAFDTAADNRAVLRISTLGWDAQGWPLSAGP